MPWQEVSTVSLRREFVALASREGAHMRALCRRFGISPTTGYKWLARAAAGEGLGDRSRRPGSSPQRSSAATEGRVLAVRDAHPAWGGRKIRARLAAERGAPLPSASTVTAILRRPGRLDPAEAAKHWALVRFERDAPNALWQRDFKGHFALAQGRCHPLSVIDDHARYALLVHACSDERASTVQAALTDTFACYGVPEALLMDNGAPWGVDGAHHHTALTVWLLRLGIAIHHGRPYHPQTQGKEERFHRTLQAEVLRARTFADLPACQEAFDTFRACYNGERPHQALGLAVPASRYVPSPRPFPAVLPPVEYAADAVIRRVQAKGEIFFRGKPYLVGRAFHRLPVELRETDAPHLVAVYFRHFHVAHLDLTQPLEA